MITSRPFESTSLMSFASGRRNGVAGAGAAARFCCTTRAIKLGGDNKERTKRTRTLRFTDDSICCKLMLVVGKRLSCQAKIHNPGRRLDQRFLATIARAFSR